MAASPQARSPSLDSVLYGARAMGGYLNAISGFGFTSKGGGIGDGG